MILKARILLNTLVTTAIGGAMGAIGDFFQQGFRPDKLDWHKVAMLALGGALMAVYFHYKPPPTEPPK